MAESEGGEMSICKFCDPQKGTNFLCEKHSKIQSIPLRCYFCGCDIPFGTSCKACYKDEEYDPTDEPIPTREEREEDEQEE